MSIGWSYCRRLPFPRPLYGMGVRKTATIIEDAVLIFRLVAMPVLVRLSLVPLMR